MAYLTYRYSLQLLPSAAMTPPAEPSTEPLEWNRPEHTVTVAGMQIGRRKFPYPYQAAVAITSDIDGTTIDKFGEIHEFLNTRASTAMGSGLGLDIADSCWMYIGTNIAGKVHPDGRTLQDQMSYWRGTSSQPAHAEAIRHYLRCGWIDSLHSYGDFNRQDGQDIAFSRRLAEQAANEWQKRGMQFPVWIDHGNAANVQNFGGADQDNLHYQQGDNPASPYYHTDLLGSSGITFLWGSTRSTAEAKLGRNSLLFPLTLRDGRRYWGFYRYTNSGLDANGQPVWNWSAHLLKNQLNEVNFQALKSANAYASFAQHLGGHANLPHPFRPLEWEPLQALAAEYHRGDILVARTARLLRYNVTDLFVHWQAAEDPADPRRAIIRITSIDDPVRGSFVPTVDDLRGLTFYCDDPWRVTLHINGVPLDPQLVQRNPPDARGQASIGVAWYPADRTNYRYDRR
ncbi:hypothetical protein EDD73_1173 [Heliophilum fasciatum]|uniref:Uncharacterized protein n=2 Tax=Heliophilum fasciatum TaxID=35700 RepID=A0A4R2RL39_9FIRM|nr:hypothetical protein EDD73_1173 [Heliophilum fasciatum]